MELESRKTREHPILSNSNYLETKSLSIINDNFLTTEALQKQEIDLIVTSPPYGVSVKYGEHNDNMPYVEYLEFSRKWLKRAYTLSKSDGRLCLNVPLDKNKGGQQSVYADIVGISKDAGWKYHTTIIWNEQNISRRTAWGSWMSASAPFVISPVEIILVMYKEVWKKKGSSRKSDITRDEFMEWTNGVWNPSNLGEESPIGYEDFPDMIWTFSGESKRRIGHPAPFPVELPKRCVKMFSYVGDTVLDPFMGSGTTLIACLQNKRNGIGVEIDKHYCDLALRRLESQAIFQEQKKANFGLLTAP
jgi:site-specific DNA-methyltransferase (adenine-specific)